MYTYIHTYIYIYINIYTYVYTHRRYPEVGGIPTPVSEIGAGPGMNCGGMGIGRSVSLLGSHWLYLVTASSIRNTSAPRQVGHIPVQ
jgi:hypothetical protein